MSTGTIQPKIFISYSWSTPQHEAWVMSLAERLMADGVNIVIDKWDLKEGHDKYSFMESMVTSQDIQKVLIILDRKYAEKADGRAGGVGTETQIISSKVYENVAQEKFIPIVAEMDTDGRPFLPAYLQSRIYIDLSATEHFEANYEKLLRAIFQRPAFTKPAVGKAPQYLFEENIPVLKTSIIVRSFDHQVDKHPQRVNAIAREFLDTFLVTLREFKVSFPSRNYVDIGKSIVDNLQRYTPLRDDYIKLMEKLSTASVPFDIDILIKFFEQLPAFEYPQDNQSQWSDYEFDNFRFIIHELFLQSTMVFLKNEQYKLSEDLLYSSYVIRTKRTAGPVIQGFEVFNHDVRSFNDFYQQAYTRNFISPMAELLVSRVPEGYSKENLVAADLLLHYVANLLGKDWFPLTYFKDLSDTTGFFTRLNSARYAEKIKGLFGATTVQNLKDILSSYKAGDTDYRSQRLSNARSPVPPIYDFIKPEAIGSTR